MIEKFRNWFQTRKCYACKLRVKTVFFVVLGLVGHTYCSDCFSERFGKVKMK